MEFIFNNSQSLNLIEVGSTRNNPPHPETNVSTSTQRSLEHE